MCLRCTCRSSCFLQLLLETASLHSPCIMLRSLKRNCPFLVFHRCCQLLCPFKRPGTVILILLEGTLPLSSLIVHYPQRLKFSLCLFCMHLTAQKHMLPLLSRRHTLSSRRCRLHLWNLLLRHLLRCLLEL